MCGILGLIQNYDFSISSSQFEKINMLNFHRGPDVQNTLSSNLSNYVNLGIQDFQFKICQKSKSNEIILENILPFNGRNL